MDFARRRQILAERMELDLHLPEAVRQAFLNVPREEFVPPEERHLAYADMALPIGYGATISQPSMLAIVLTELRLQPGLRVLEAGSGCGYFLALLAAMGAEATGIEVVPELARESRAALEKLRIPVEVLEGNAAELKTDERFDRVVFSAAVRGIPEWSKELLTDDGFVLAPVGVFDHQELIRADKRGEVRTGRLCRFVRFIEPETT